MQRVNLTTHYFQCKAASVVYQELKALYSVLNKEPGSFDFTSNGDLGTGHASLDGDHR